MKLNIVILAGGQGERLWPLVNQDRSKPLLKLNGQKTLLEETIDRYKDLGDIFLVMTREQIVQAKKIIPGGSVEYIEEISPSGTSVAMRLAADQFLGKEVVLFVHADQAFDNHKELHASIINGLPFAEKGDFVAYGTKPTRADPQLGYFKVGSDQRVERFYEKPSLEIASSLIKDETIFVNSGIYLVRADILIDAWEKHFNPQLRSFEHSILMNVSNISALTLSSQFVDLGKFEAIESLLGLKIGSNYLSSKVKTKKVKNCLIYSETLPVKVIDVENLIVVSTGAGILIAKKEHSASQKELSTSEKN